MYKFWQGTILIIFNHAAYQIWPTSLSSIVQAFLFPQYNYNLIVGVAILFYPVILNHAVLVLIFRQERFHWSSDSAEEIQSIGK